MSETQTLVATQNLLVRLYVDRTPIGPPEAPAGLKQLTAARRRAGLEPVAAVPLAGIVETLQRLDAAIRLVEHLAELRALERLESPQPPRRSGVITLMRDSRTVNVVRVRYNSPLEVLLAAGGLTTALLAVLRLIRDWRPDTAKAVAAAEIATARAHTHRALAAAIERQLEEEGPHAAELLPFVQLALDRVNAEGLLRLGEVLEDVAVVDSDGG